MHHSSNQTDVRTSPHIQNEGASSASALEDHLPDLPVLTPDTTGSEGTSGNSPASLLSNFIGPSTVEAEQNLTAFHTYKAKDFPFVYIPSTITAQQLRQDRPFLMALHNDDSIEINVTATTTWQPYTTHNSAGNVAQVWTEY